MGGFNKKDEDMSMEDILSSIRKYVSEEDVSKINKNTLTPNDQQNIINNDKVINLDASNILPSNAALPGGTMSIQDNNDKIKQSIIETESNQQYSIDSFNTNNNSNNNTENNAGQNSPFNKLAEALKAYGKKKDKINDLNYNMTVEQFLRTIIESYLQKWMDENLKKIVEQIVLKEVEKLKSE